MKKKLVLLPTFSPPLPQSLSCSSTNDRLNVLLNMKSYDEKNNIVRNNLKTQNLSENSRHDGNIISKKTFENISSDNSTDYLNLFEGDINYNIQQAQLPKSNTTSSNLRKHPLSTESFNKFDDPEVIDVTNIDSLTRRSNKRSIDDFDQDSINSFNTSNKCNNKNDANMVDCTTNKENDTITQNKHISNTNTIARALDIPNLLSNDVNHVLKYRDKSAPNKQQSNISISITHSNKNNYDKSCSSNNNITVRKFQMDEFNGMSTFCRNVGSTAGFQVFASKLRAKNSLFSLALIYTDMTSTHMTSSVKYCTPSQKCHKWYCTCDRNIRTHQAYNTNVLALVVVFGDEPDYIYFLSLLPTEDEISQYQLKQKSNLSNQKKSSHIEFDTMQLKCQITLRDRWLLLVEIVNLAPTVVDNNNNNNNNKSVINSQEMKSSTSSTQSYSQHFDHEKPTVIIYNYQIFMLILATMQKRYNFSTIIRSAQNSIHNNTPHSQSTNINNLQNDNVPNNNITTSSSSYYNIFDPKVASYLCKVTDTLTDGDMEIIGLCKLYNIDPPVSSFEQSDYCPISILTSNANITSSVQLGKITKIIGQIFLEMKVLLKLYYILNNKVIHMNLTHIYHTMEIPLTYILSKMEVQGVCISMTKLEELTHIVQSQINNIENQVADIIQSVYNKMHNIQSTHENTPTYTSDLQTSKFIINTSSSKVNPENYVQAPSINLSSPEQVAYLLYNVLNLDKSLTSSSSVVTQGKRHLSTSEEDLQKIKHKHPVVPLILTHRALNKSLNTYLDGLRPFITCVNIKPHALQLLYGEKSTEYDEEYDNNNKSDEDGEEYRRANNGPNVSSLTPYEQLLSHTVTSHVDHHSRSSSSSSSCGSSNKDGKSTHELATRIHSVWNQSSVRTGRLSCCRPNLQSIPKTLTLAVDADPLTFNQHNLSPIQTSVDIDSTIESSSSTAETNYNSTMNLNIRSLFVASEGYTIVSADYSQIEVRILAHLSNDPNGHEDVYRSMAASIFKHSNTMEVTSSERDKAKTICLGVIYGMGAPAMAGRLGIEVATATKIMQAFFERFRQVQSWMSRVKASARDCGYVLTLNGRRRYIDNIKSTHHNERAYAERQAVNSIVQGSASEVIKLAMLIMDKHITKQTFYHNPPPNNSYSNSQNSMLYNDSNDTDHVISLSNKPNSNYKDILTQESNILKSYINTRLIMQIHDELIFEVKQSNKINNKINNNSDNNINTNTNNNNIHEFHYQLNENSLHNFITILKYCMEKEVTQILNLNVPLIANVKVGPNWGDLKDY